MRDGTEYDLAVIGGGMGGLAAASLAQRMGMKTVLFEAHTRLGGCAGYFPRGPFTFDAGATALMGLEPDEPLGGLLRVIGLDFKSQRTTSYRVHMPDRTIDIVADARAFERRILDAFPGHDSALLRFWRLQAAVGEALFRSSGGVPRLPLRSFADLLHDLRILGLAGTLGGLTSLVTVRDVLRILGLDRDPALRAFIAMLLQDTAQTGPETVPFANASVFLQAYRQGMSRPVGGMKALAEGIGHRFAALGGAIRTGTLVDRVEPIAARSGPGGFHIVTRRRGHEIHARQVVFNLTLDLAASLLGRSIEPGPGYDRSLARSVRKTQAVWSACTAYLAIERQAVPEDTPLFHQVLQSIDRPIHGGNNVLVSLSTPDDLAYGPSNVRVATLSTHTYPGDWTGLDPETYPRLKDSYRSRLLEALERALPESSRHLVHEEYATPRSFSRYTRRMLGAVGGPPVTRRNSNLFAVSSDVLGCGLWLVGDSVFPGQGTMATVMSSIRVIERLTGTGWNAILHLAPSHASPVSFQPVSRISSEVSETVDA